MATNFPFALSRFSTAENRWTQLSAHPDLAKAKQAASRLRPGNDDRTDFKIDNYTEGRTWTATYIPRQRMTWKELV